MTLIKSILVNSTADIWPYELRDEQTPEDALREEYPLILFDFQEAYIGVDNIRLSYPFVSYDLYDAIALCNLPSSGEREQPGRVLKGKVTDLVN